ncbi:MAG: M28 family metallopeptidase [candidate division KSB1 bacterium]|nr:M28 family metallopeptidase [candidate division KSB1 bacterium]MDZ7275185.1 M28 family metallopeptidase [candidate division KSB1 bacterium]MDZ7287354.1 M28 family metallopeptidase [candidate division KSB1 bacterium]MDZ7299468.1 M28 family metallopeptidase [candidate division KSB1 bacterium]MDZ7305486.1 M28 family metallopeptidase [candidate division KSB1 bacterium]
MKYTMAVRWWPAGAAAKEVRALAPGWQIACHEAGLFHVAALLMVGWLCLAPPLAGQTLIQRDPAIVAMLAEVSRERLEANIRALASFHTRHSLSDTVSEQRGIGAARRWIKAELERYSRQSGGRLVVAFDPFVVEADGRRIAQRTVMQNVLARLPGSDPADTRVLIISGHYDSRASDPLDATSQAPGANDDASGTAVVMELARVMSRHAFPATLVFAAVAGEEQGLYGSSHLAQRAHSEKWNVIAMITNDIVGNTRASETGLHDNTHVRVFSEGVPAAESEAEARRRQAVGSENDSPARQLARYFKAVGERYVDLMNVMLIYRRDRFLRGGDHTPFSRLGFTAVRVTEMYEDFTRQHQNVRSENGVAYGDLPDFVDYPYVAQVARLNLAVLANLALAPAAPDSVVILTRELTNKTSLRWRPPATGRSPAGYRVLMRETISPYWQHTFEAGNVTSCTLPYSKDNYLFAVQSIDAAGHESLPVFPTPSP